MVYNGILSVSLFPCTNKMLEMKICKYDLEDVMSYVSNLFMNCCCDNTLQFSLCPQETLEVNTCESLGTLLEREPKEDKHARSILYDSKVESGTITFNFDSLVESSEQSEDDQKVSTAVNLLDSGQEEWTHSNKTKSNNKSDENEGISGKSSNLDDDNNSASTSVADRLEECDDAGGESSFFVADEGILHNSASLSFRSDGSTASTTSFAFPMYINLVFHIL